MLGVLTVGLLLMLEVGKGDFIEPLVHWSMDAYDDFTLLPDFGNATKFSVHLPATRRENRFTVGIIGQALSLSSEKLNLMRNIGKADCLRNPITCKSGLSISFWLHLKKLTRDNYQVILRSTVYDGSGPGIFIGGDEDSSMMRFQLRTASGTLYTRKIPWFTVKMKWCHFVLKWNSSYGIEVFLNGSTINGDQDIVHGEDWYPTNSDFSAGDVLGPEFLLDDLWIFYHSLQEDIIFNLYELGLPPLHNPKPSNLKDANMTVDKDALLTTIHSDIIATVHQEKFSSGIHEATTSSGVVQLHNTSDPAKLPEDHRYIPTTQQSQQPTAGRNIVTTISENASHLEKNISFKATVLSSPTVATKTISSKNTQGAGLPSTLNRTMPYNGWFYNQSWYHIFVGVTLFAVFAILSGLCLVHCIIPQRNVKQSDSTAMKPLMQVA